jgi:hypothetical protein
VVGKIFLPFSSIGREAGHWIHNSPFSRICLGYSSEPKSRTWAIAIKTSASAHTSNNTEKRPCIWNKVTRVMESVYVAVFPVYCTYAVWRVQNIVLHCFSILRLLVVIWTKVVTSAICPLLFSVVIREMFFPPPKLKPKCCEAAAHSQASEIRSKMLQLCLLFGLSNQGEWYNLQVLHKSL